MQTMSNGRIRRTEKEWQGVLSRCRKSGLSPRAFCDQEGIPFSSFQRWEKRLKSAPAPSEFIAVTTESPATSTGSTWSVELTLPNGCTLRLQG